MQGQYPLRNGFVFLTGLMSNDVSLLIGVRIFSCCAVLWRCLFGMILTGHLTPKMKRTPRLAYKRLGGRFVNRQVSALCILFIMFVSTIRSCKGSPCLQSSSDYRAQLLYQELSITVDSKEGIPSYSSFSLFILPGLVISLLRPLM